MLYTELRKFQRTLCSCSGACLLIKYLWHFSLLDFYIKYFLLSRVLEIVIFEKKICTSLKVI